jgi:sRNA-binding regulator protein Hfq
MKDILDSTPPGLAESRERDHRETEQQENDHDHFANRKLIRPALPRLDHGNGHANGSLNSGHAFGHAPHPNALPLQMAERRPDRSPDRNHDRNHDRSQDRGRERGPERSFDRGLDRNDRSSGATKKAPPPEQTNAENFYYQKQMQSRTPMVIVLQDGEEVHGVIEWYDKACIKVIREDGGPNLMIYKPAIKYMFKEEESRGNQR